MKILVALLILTSCSGGRNSTGYSLINDMMHSMGYESFSENPHFKNGQTMQPAPKGTIARGWMPGDMDGDGRLIMVDSPITELNKYQWQRGKMLFEKTCSSCHGVKGKGDGLVVTQGGYPQPTKFTARRWRKKDKETGNYVYPSGHVYKVITEGYGNMASHAQQLYPEDRWLVSTYVREFLMRGGSYYKKDLKEVLGE
jgi:mono/diheme cytochrome c family protein